ncbi:MAG: carotenoid 1,2-hydratase [Nitrospirae bacterium]|nr:MAG: carotenoid 1,2-hydratase [Nitrospirota bacterium]
MNWDQNTRHRWGPAMRWITGVSCALWALQIAPVELTAATEFRTALPGYPYRFPFDHGSHDDFQTEWWYYTGHLRADDGRTFGYQLTFFRRAVARETASKNPSRWHLRHLYFAHFAVTDEAGRRFQFMEKISRAGIHKAGAATGRLAVWIDDWRAEADGDSQVLHAQGEGIAIRLRLTPEKPPVIHGTAGVSRKGEGPGESSHYYSVTRLRTEGTLTFEEKSRTVSGLSWMDHEFGSNQLGASQIGWDWFSLQLTDATELMVYRIRRSDGTIEPASGGTWIRPDGSAVPLARAAIAVEELDLSPQSRGRYPARWRLTVPYARLSVEIVPTVPQQELLTRRSTQVTYWEGSVTVTGERAGRPVTGLGYVELTGYAAPLRRRL